MKLASFVSILPSVVFLSACGGGDGDGDSATAPPTSASGPSTADRTVAASATATSGSNACAAIRPFYWEIGDRNSRLASGSVASSSDPTVYTASSVVSIASASKWLYSSYVVEKQGGVLSESDLAFLNFQSGYTNFLTCAPDQTVQQCVDFAANGVRSDAAVGKFSYGGGHMQKHAALIGLGSLDNTALAAEIRSRLGNDIALSYVQPQLAGGAATSADDYARFLRKILAGDLRMRDALGTHPVCTNPTTCPAGTAVYAPVPSSMSWHYSVGHWVEDDPVSGDGAFSSAGAFGFYPWIDAGKAFYGIVSRREEGGAWDSVQCGVIVRKAWATAVAQ